MVSNRGQNFHVVVSCQLVILSCNLSSRHFNLSFPRFNLSSRHVNSPYRHLNLSSRVSTHRLIMSTRRHFMLHRLNDRLYEDMDGIDYLCVQVDRIQNLVQRASALYNIPSVVVDTLRRAHDSLKFLATGNEDISLFTSTGCCGRPALHIPEDLLQLYLDYQFPLAKIGEIFGVSSKTI